MDNKTDKISFDLIHRKILGVQLSEEEERIIQDWVKEDPAHQHYFEQMESYAGRRERGEVNENEIDSAWNVFVRKIEMPKRSRISYHWVAVAAMMTLFIGIAGWWQWGQDRGMTVSQEESVIVPGRQQAILELADGKTYDLGQMRQQGKELLGHRILVDSGQLSYIKAESQAVNEVVEYNRLSIPRGGEYQLKLDDGTKVWLNSESCLKYPSSFMSETREVFLEGEAYFEVAKDAARPFIVHTGIHDITVLGTCFGITSYKDEDIQSTTLVEGKVKIEFANRAGKAYVLRPGEQFVYNNTDQSTGISKVDVTQFVAWREGKYVFRQKRLEDMLSTLSRWYDFQVFYQNPQAKEILFSGELKRFDSFSAMLRLIQKTSDVKFEVKGNVVCVSQ